MAPSGRRVNPGSSSSSSSSSAASSEASRHHGSNGSKSLPAILARKRKSDGDHNSSQDTSTSSSSAISFTSSSSSSFLLEEIEDDLPSEENFPPDGHGRLLLPPAHSSCPTSRMPLSTLQQHQQHQQQQQQHHHNPASSSSQGSRPKVSLVQQKQHLLKAMPKLRMDERAEANKAEAAIPPAAKKLRLRTSWSQFREFIRTTSLGESGRAGVAPPRGCSPFPRLRWADRQEMWDLICKKEFGMYQRRTGQELTDRHPALQPRMRAILLDWIIEVCEVYRLHRETFFLAVDFIDRYLTITRDVPKNRLQLIGVTSLFIGSKIEEIYPPKLSEFAYVTDGACSEDEILTMELVILKELNWGLSPMTPNAWIKLYMQISSVGGDVVETARDDQVEVVESEDKEDGSTFVTPQFSGLAYTRVMQLLDLAVLDVGSLSYRYSVLAAAALAHCQGRGMALAASGHRWEGELAQCVAWLAPFVATLSEERFRPVCKSLQNVSAENQHNIQTHAVDLSALERVCERQMAANRSSPDLTTNPVLLVDMTPPETEGDIHFKEQQQQRLVTPTTTTAAVAIAAAAASSSGHAPPSVFLSPETPTTLNRSANIHH